MPSELTERILSVEPVVGSKKPHRGIAPKIRKLKMKHPELSHADIAKRVGCQPSNVTGVLKTFLGKHSEDNLRSYQDNQVDVFDSLSYRFLGSITQRKIDKLKPVEAVTAAAILFDKKRLLQGLATGINVNVLIDAVAAIRSMPQPITDSKQ